MKLINKLVSTLVSRAKMKLAEKGVIVLAEPVDKEKNVYRVYCPKCRTWHTAYLSGLPEKRALPPTMRRDTVLLVFIALFILDES